MKVQLLRSHKLKKGSSTFFFSFLCFFRLGIRSLVLESSDTLRAAGIAFTTWTNAWRALDALGIADSLRQQHGQLFGYVLKAVKICHIIIPPRRARSYELIHGAPIDLSHKSMSNEC